MTKQGKFNYPLPVMAQMFFHKASADRLQLNLSACFIPSSIRLALRFSSRYKLIICVAMASGSFGLAYNALLPPVSGMAEVFAVITGTPHCIASIIGKPKPSKNEGYTSAYAAPVTLARSASGRLSRKCGLIVCVFRRRASKRLQC